MWWRDEAEELALSLRGLGRGEFEAEEAAAGVVRPLAGADRAAGELLPEAEEGEGALIDEAAEDEEGRGGKFCAERVATEAVLSFLPCEWEEEDVAGVGSDCWCFGVVLATRPLESALLLDGDARCAEVALPPPPPPSDLAPSLL